MPLNVPNLDKLIAHLEAQPPERINMGYGIVMDQGSCGTCGCIAGHIETLPASEEYWSVSAETTISKFLGIDRRAAERLGYPIGYSSEIYGVALYPAHRVIATLKRLRDHYLATGEIVVDWGPEPTSGEPWAAPQAVELTPPALPAEITRLLAPEPSALTTSEA